MHKILNEKEIVIRSEDGPVLEILSKIAIGLVLIPHLIVWIRFIVIPGDWVAARCGPAKAIVRFHPEVQFHSVESNVIC